MAVYIVAHSFRSQDLILEAGQRVEYTEDFAAWLNRNSPGLLIPELEVQTADVEAAPAHRAIFKAPKRKAKAEKPAEPVQSGVQFGATRSGRRR